MKGAGALPPTNASHRESLCKAACGSATCSRIPASDTGFRQPVASEQKLCWLLTDLLYSVLKAFRPGRIKLRQMLSPRKVSVFSSFRLQEVCHIKMQGCDARMGTGVLCDAGPRMQNGQNGHGSVPQARG